MRGKGNSKEKTNLLDWECEQTIQEDFAILAQQGEKEMLVSEQTIQEDFATLAQQFPEIEEKNLENSTNGPLSKSQYPSDTIAKKTSLEAENLEKIYKIQDEIAQGGMGVIHRVWDQDLQREMAMKIWKNQGKENEDTSSFLAEARVTARLEHPNIIPVHDMGLMFDKRVYFTMKLISGEDVFSIIDKISHKEKEYLEKYTLHKLLTIFRKVCDAVAFAHFREIVHRDIKPQNVMVGNHGEVLLMDWGIAKILNPREYEKISFPQENQGKIIGTPHYMSPEQARGDNQAVDKRSDIYLLGATLYHILTLYPPHKGSNILQTLYFIQQGKIQPPHERNHSRLIPLELSRIVMKCLALKPEDRYQDVESLCEDIDHLMSGTIVSRPIHFKKGDFLMRQGEEGENAYSILSGSAEIFQNISNRSVLLATLEAGSVVGEMGLISSNKRSADVVAKEDMDVLVIDKKLLKESLDKMPPWMEKIVSSLVSRLQTANNNIHPLKIGDPVYHILNQLGMIVTFLSLKKNISQESLELEYDVVVKDIASTLCISEEKIQKAIPVLFQFGICEWGQEKKFHFKDFLLFCHVMAFLRNTLEIDLPAFWLDKLPSLDHEKNILRCQIAAELSKEAKEFLSNIPIYAKYIIA